tara:strand:+ start:503 stop:730 length:228 start_codon:yes stop_codon:yes gene_type:complete
MIDALLIIGCIVFFILMIYGLQMRNRMKKKYPNSCDVLYFPKKENIINDQEKQPEVTFIPDSSYRLYDPGRISGF